MAFSRTGFVCFSPHVASVPSFLLEMCSMPPNELHRQRSWQCYSPDRKREILETAGIEQQPVLQEIGVQFMEIVVATRYVPYSLFVPLQPQTYGFMICTLHPPIERCQIAPMP